MNVRVDALGSHEARSVGHDYGEVMKNAGLFLAAPLIGLAYIVSYGAVGTAAALCYGLKAFGVRCGVFAE